MKSEEIKITRIITDGGTESRPLNQQIVTEYAEIYKADPIKLPPLDIFFDGKAFWLGDGFHRFAGAMSARLKTIPANVYKGGRTEALKHSLGSNDRHGYRRTAEDKRYAVTKALQEFRTWSDRGIAQLCRVSPTLVGQVRAQQTVHVDSSNGLPTEKRIGRDGKARRMPHHPPEREVVSTVSDNEPQTECSVPPQETMTTRSAGEIAPVLGDQTQPIDEALQLLDEVGQRYVSLAQRTIDQYPRSIRKVRSLLNVLRSKLDEVIEGDSPEEREE